MSGKIKPENMPITEEKLNRALSLSQSPNMSSEIKPENMAIKKYDFVPSGTSDKKYDFTGTDVARRMVIKLIINNLCILRVNVNPTSKADILYWSLFLKMGFSESMLKPCETCVLGEGVPVKGYIDLDTIFGDQEENAKMIKVRYLVIDSPSAYNIVIGLPALKTLKAFISLPNLTLEYPIELIEDGEDGEVVEFGVGVVETDLEMAKKCQEMYPHTI